MTLPPQLSTQELSDTHCFLCGDDKQAMSDEHVIPQWLLRDYGLWDNHLTLLNKTTIPYRLLTVPCCVDCNNESLSNLEDIIARAVRNGYSAANALDKKLWFLWALKLVYGLWRKELNLLLSRRDSTQGTIVTEEHLKSLGYLHLFLQEINGKHRFRGTPPYSVLVCNLHEVEGVSKYFLKDNLLYQIFSVRMGEVGIIVCFSDNGFAEENYKNLLSAINGCKLHPLQFDELYAHVAYEASLRDDSSTYITALDDTTGISETEVVDSYVVREGSRAEFADVLRIELSHWSSDDGFIEYVPPNAVSSFLFKEDGITPNLKTKEE